MNEEGEFREPAVLWYPDRDLTDRTPEQLHEFSQKLALLTARPLSSPTFHIHGVTFTRVEIPHGPLFVGNLRGSKLFRAPKVEL